MPAAVFRTPIEVRTYFELRTGGILTKQVTGEDQIAAGDERGREGGGERECWHGNFI